MAMGPWNDPSDDGDINLTLRVTTHWSDCPIHQSWLLPRPPPSKEIRASRTPRILHVKQRLPALLSKPLQEMA